jgi:hypothetical protein
MCLDDSASGGCGTVMSGGLHQAMFFQAYVKSFVDNILNDGEMFGEIAWAGGTVEWCVDGTSHLHLIFALTRITKMEECFDNSIKMAALERWWGEHFCECVEHKDGTYMSVLQKQGKLVHKHTLLKVPE